MNITIGQGPCPPHQWSHAPTVGYFSCLKCRERVDYDDPRYSEVEAEYRAPVSVAVDDDALVERLRGFEALVADYGTMLEKADDIGLNVLGNDLREVQSAIDEAIDRLQSLLRHPPC